jgi:hypothetical protein
MIARYAVLVLATQLISCHTTSAQDHLVPEEGILNRSEASWSHAKVIREVLLKDAATYHLARMVCLPAFQRKWVVTLVREDGQDWDAPHTYYVEYVGAVKKLIPPRGSGSVSVKKSRASIDGETAEAVNKTWRRMLHATRYPEELRLVTDGETYAFSRFVPVTDRGKNDPLWGWEQGRIWSPDETSLCGELVAIGEQLKEYALARPEDRDKVRSEIRVKTDQLRAKLDRPRVPRPQGSTRRGVGGARL